MSTTKFAAAAIVALGAFGFLMPVAAQAADGTSTVKMADTDKDGTVDMAEAKTAAMSHFKSADTDHEGTLDSKEAGMNVSGVDTDKDGTVDQAEYGKAVAATFESADADHDGTVDAKEFDSPAGEKLSAMMGAKG